MFLCEKTIEDFSLPDIPVSFQGKGRSLEGRVNSNDECGNDGLRINAPVVTWIIVHCPIFYSCVLF